MRALLIALAFPFFFSSPEDPALDRARESYARGEHFAAYLHARRLAGRGTPPLDDDARLIAGLALLDGEFFEAAEAAFRRLLNRPGPSVYHPVALAALLQSALARGDTDAAAREARRACDLWQGVPSRRDAIVKQVLLETGNLARDPDAAPLELVSSRGLPFGARERVADRALYTGGLALLRGGDFARAAECLAPILPPSPHHPFARYALGQALYGLGDLAGAERAFLEAETSSDPGTSERFLRDRAALARATVAFERDDPSVALGALRGVDTDGPFAVHAAVLGAEIEAERGDPALALVHLDIDAPRDAKLEARVASLRTELGTAIGDGRRAISGVEEAVTELERYAGELRELAAGGVRLERLRSRVRNIERERERLEAWRRRNVTRAAGELQAEEPGPSPFAWLIPSWIGRAADRLAPPPPPYDAFNALPPPEFAYSGGLGEPLHAAVTRRLLDGTSRRAFAFGVGLERASRSGDRVHRAATALDAVLRLRGDSAREQVLLEALESPGRLRSASAGRLRRLELRWAAVERKALVEAARAEEREVRDLLYALQVRLSRALFRTSARTSDRRAPSLPR